MIDLTEIVDLVSTGADLLKNHAPDLPLTLMAAGFIVIGGILTFFGARTLRMMFIVTFLIVGGVIGIQSADKYEVDLLIGVVLGAGLAAIVGHLMFRWWVAITAGVLTMIVVASVSGHGGWIEAMNEFAEHQQERLSAEDYLNGLPDGSEEMPTVALGAYLSEARQWLWANHQGLIMKSGVVCGLAFLLGVVSGSLAPKFTMVVGTTIAGVSMILFGTGVLLISTERLQWLESIEAYPRVFWVVVIGLLLFGIMAQTTRRRPKASSDSDAELAAA